LGGQRRYGVSDVDAAENNGTDKGETIVQAHGIGPFKVNWLNPSEVQPPDSSAAPKAK
jgi:hypothetical protein